MKEKKICPRCKRPMKKDNELVTKGAVKEAIRKEMSKTGGFTCGSHGVMCGELVKAIDKLPIESIRKIPSENKKARVVK